ncbi:MAG: chromosome segregation protein SMC [Clostridiales bacterium]|nr:chromosome segregation protein SMC [Clostridiales bacterium]
MKFKKLTLIGFKSFANRLEVKFGEGITAIVGPNGCGKSNVADAVRWVLGEQSAKLLRGSKMMDVIFNGSKKRKALSYAEVALTFDNHNRSLFPSCEFEEVVMARKLFRSGESEYYINGSQCRLRDINDMLRDAGFAIEGYTIIGQGRVMEIINAKPEDRRSVFEEAAGISKYKYKKTEAERKNARTRENLVRLNDILSNDTERLAPLARQAEKTRQYREIKDKLKQHEINLYINRYETASGTKDKLSAVIADIDAQIKDKQRAYAAATEDYNSAMAELQTIDSTLDKYHYELTNLTVNKEKISGQINLLRQQIENISAQTRSLMATNTTLNDNYGNLTVTAAEKQDELRRKSDALKLAREEYERVNAEYNKVSDSVIAEEQKINAARHALLAAMERRAAVNRSVGELSAERTGLSAQIEEYKAKLAEYESKIAAVTDGIKTLDEQLISLRAERDELISQKDKASDENIGVVARLASLGGELSQAKQDLSALVSRRRVLEDVQRDAYTHAVRKLLEDAQTIDRIKNAVVGVIGQVISVKEGFEAAVDMALGNAVNNIVTKDEDDAKLLVEHLKANKYGRATFLPITSFKPRVIDKELLPLLDRQGCFGVATNALTYDSVFDPVIKGLLGSTVIVDNMDTAVSLARDSKYGFRIVTLDGDIVTPQGAITGGSKKSDASNVFAHERTLKEIIAQADSLKAKIDGLQSERDELNLRNENLIKRVKELTEDIHDYDLAEAAKTAESNAMRSDLTALMVSKTTDTNMLKQLNMRLEETNADLSAVEQTQDDIGLDAHSEENSRINKEFDLLRNERDRLHDCVAANNLQIVTLEKDIEALQSEIARLKSEAVATASRLESNNMTILTNNRAMQECDEKIKELSVSSSDGNDKRRQEIQAKLDGLSQHKADLNVKSVESDKARLEYNDQISQLTERKHEQEILLAQVDVNMENMQTAIYENYGLAYENCLEFKEENYDAANGEIEIAKLRRRILNLGSINENAIEEAQELSQKVGRLSQQRDDMIKSLADEERIIKEMSANMMRDFDACFEQIRENFKVIFRELFGGGTADLQLTENEDPLLRGVEIVAQPPSKNLQSISLLSGGEKTLTAIAIMFAIIKLRPMPFCLLDEIEAALDEANVGRVAAMIKRFAATTQFIVITHRKPTMEEADCLYGVTMEEEGVSTIVSVRLGDALKGAVSIPKAKND